MSRIRALCSSAFVIGAWSMQAACAGAPPRGTAPPLAISTLPAAVLESATTGAYIVIDSLSLRQRMEGSDSTPGGGAILITTYQGGRYHPEIVRALANDSVVLQRFAMRLARDIAGRKRVILDFQGSTPGDIGELTAVARSIGGMVRARRDSLSIVVPAQDTAAYPTLILARVADMLIVRLEGEHRPGTPPGPLTSPDFITRSIGMRASRIGTSRIGVEIPLYGYVWDKDRNARLVTFREAEMLVRSESGVFTRDPASQFLTATGREGWVLWVPDSTTVRFLVDAVRRRGVRVVYLAGPGGADPGSLHAAY
jgi:hypothetical protein